MARCGDANHGTWRTHTSALAKKDRRTRRLPSTRRATNSWWHPATDSHHTASQISAYDRALSSLRAEDTNQQTFPNLMNQLTNIQCIEREQNHQALLFCLNKVTGELHTQHCCEQNNSQSLVRLFVKSNAEKSTFTSSSREMVSTTNMSKFYNKKKVCLSTWTFNFENLVLQTCSCWTNA